MNTKRRNTTTVAAAARDAQRTHHTNNTPETKKKTKSTFAAKFHGAVQPIPSHRMHCKDHPTYRQAKRSNDTRLANQHINNRTRSNNEKPMHTQLHSSRRRVAATTPPDAKTHIDHNKETMNQVALPTQPTTHASTTCKDLALKHRRTHTHNTASQTTQVPLPESRLSNRTGCLAPPYH